MSTLPAAEELLDFACIILNWKGLEAGLTPPAHKLRNYSNMTLWCGQYQNTCV
jgi:hypothetical protein